MAIYSTFFLCEPEGLQAGFPGWQGPLPQPRSRTIRNPFTGEQTTVTTREPEWEDIDPDHVEMPDYHVVAIEGDYQTYLEQRIPPFVQTQPHWCAKGLTSLEMSELVAAANGVDEAELETPLYAHPSLGAAMDRFPDDFLTALKNVDDTTLRNMAEKWAARMSVPDHTHSMDGERIYDDWTVEDALILLEPLAELAKKRSDGQSLFLLVEA